MSFYQRSYPRCWKRCDDQFHKSTSISNDNPENMVTAYTNFIDNISGIDARYPTAQDKYRQWQDFKIHRFVEALKDHDEFRDF